MTAVDERLIAAALEIRSQTKLLQALVGLVTAQKLAVLRKSLDRDPRAVLRTVEEAFRRRRPEILRLIDRQFGRRR